VTAQLGNWPEKPIYPYIPKQHISGNNQGNTKAESNQRKKVPNFNVPRVN
jgi:hypothetical protein